MSSTISSTPVAGLEGADVPPLAADDAALHVVARQVDDRHRGFDGVLGGAPLDGVRDDLLRPLRGGLPGLRLQPLDQVGGVAARVGLELLEEQLARLVGGESGDALQLALALRDQLFGPGDGRRGAAFALAGRLLARCAARGRGARSRRGDRRGRASCRRATVRGRGFPAGARAPSLSACATSACAISRASSAASLRRVSASRSACAVICPRRSLARPMVRSSARRPVDPPVGDGTAGDGGRHGGVGEVDGRHSHA